MRWYYQYEVDGMLSARVKSAGIPLHPNQIILETPLITGIKKFDVVTKEIIYYKNIYDENEEIIDTVEDTDIPRVKINAVNILKKD